MTIRFQCAGCKRTLTVEPHRAGAKVKCPNCGRVTVPPAAGDAVPPAAGDAVPPAAGDAVPPAAGDAVPPEEIPPVRFAGKRESDDEMDMTPMVDVTFLLLIFFMVTAAYSLQRSLEVPPPERQDSATEARTIEEMEQEDNYVIVRIDRDDTFWVTAFGIESMAQSRHQLLVELRAALEAMGGSDSPAPPSLLVMAHGDCRHETVVMALDAGNAVGMDQVQLATADEAQF